MSLFTDAERLALNAALDRTYHPCHVDHDDPANADTHDGWEDDELKALDTLVEKVEGRAPIHLWTVRTSNRNGEIVTLHTTQEGAEKTARAFVAEEDEHWSHGLDLSGDLYELIDQLQEASGWTVDVEIDNPVIGP